MYILIQARSTSKRFPNKVMAMVDGKPLIRAVWDQCLPASGGKQAVLIPYNDGLVNYLDKEEMLYLYNIEGDENDVLSRYMKAANTLNARWIVRITADCPMIDLAHLVFMMRVTELNNLDFITNAPCQDGNDIEIVSRRCLRWVDACAKTPESREHVTLYIKKHYGEFDEAKMNRATYNAPYLLEWLPKTSIDTPDDLDRVNKILKQFKKERGMK